MVEKRDPLAVAKQIRSYRIRRRFERAVMLTALFIVCFLLCRSWYLCMADRREWLSGRVINVQVVDVGDQREMWVYWARRGTIEVERRGLPDGLPGR